MNKKRIGFDRFSPAVGLRLAVLVLLAVVALAACSADSPTAPQQPQTSVPPNAPVPSTTWNLQVDANPNFIEVGGTPVDVLVIVNARRAGSTQPPPDGASVILTTTLGGFLAADGSLVRTLIVTVRNGTASAILRFDGVQTGTAVVQAQLEQSFGQAVVELAEEPPPPPPPPEPPPPPPPAPFFISEIQPNVGEPSGIRARILGSGIDPPIRVLIGDRVATVRGSSSSSITVDVPPVNLPAGQTLTVPVTVTINFNETDPDQPPQTDTLPNAFTYARGAGGGGVQIPVIFSISPTSGPNEGGTEVVIRGEGFSDEVQVFFSSGALVEVPLISVSPTRLVGRTPAATGPNSINLNTIVDVRVVNADTGFEDVLAGGFQYGDGQGGAAMFISSAGPTEGPYTGGTVTTIFGQGFEEPVAVGFGGVAQEVISVTGTEIVARSVRIQLADCMDVSGPFSVTNIETGETAASTIEWIYRVFRPIINSIVPSSVMTDANGNILPGEPMTITIGGAQFDPPVQVRIAGRVAFNAAVDPSGTMITADIPSFVGEFETESCDDDGDGTQGTRLLPTAVDVQVINLPSTCEVTLTQRFTYVPPSDCRDDMGPPPPPPPPAAPVIFGVSPTSGSRLGGTAITITGQGFGSNVLVEIAGNLAPVSSASDMSISATTPAFTGMMNTQACDDNMDGTQGTREVPTTVSVTVTNLETGLSDTRNAFIYDPDPSPAPCIGD